MRTVFNRHCSDTAFADSDNISMIGEDTRTFDLSKNLSSALWQLMEAPTKTVQNDFTEPISSSGCLTRVERIIQSSAFRELSERVLKSAKSDKPVSSNTEWTIVLNLTTDFDHNKDGSFNRVKDLEEFAKKTKGTSLVVVAQAAYRIPPDPPVPFGMPYKPEFRLERFVVKDGSITRVAEGKSKGYGQDLEDLVSYAGHNAKSTKMALIMDTHGIGNEGLLGDTGEVTLGEFIKRVQGGLKGSGRDKFDLIDFDACLMSQNGVLERVGNITDFVVASAELEPHKGISLIPPLEILTREPKTDARGLGRIIINEARTQAIDFAKKGIDAPLPTVASIDIKKYGEFRKSLDDFGDKLVEAMADAKTKAAIVEVIDSTFRYKRNEFDDVAQADLKDFTQRVISAIDEGLIADPDRSLKRSVLAVQSKQGELIDAFYGHKDYKTTGGLSVFLPNWFHREPHYMAESSSVSGSLLHMTAPDKFAEVNKSDKSRGEFIRQINRNLQKMLPLYLSGGIPTLLGTTMYSELNDVSKAREKFANADADKQRKEAFDELRNAAKRLHATIVFKHIFDTNLNNAIKDIDKDFELQLVDEGKSGWTRFQRAMRYHAKK